MPARIVQQPSNPYARSSYVYDDDRGRERDYSDRVASYSSPRRGSVYDYASAYEDDRRYHSRERGRHVSAEELDRQRRSNEASLPERVVIIPLTLLKNRAPPSVPAVKGRLQILPTVQLPHAETRLLPEEVGQQVDSVGGLEAGFVRRMSRGDIAVKDRRFEMWSSNVQLVSPPQEPIPLRYVEQLFDADFKKIWNRKFSEYTTRNRLYCPSRKCGEWIMPDSIRRENGRKVARCGRCKTKVCGSCGLNYHSSTTCPNDEATNKFLSQAQDEGWKRCYRCQAVVELREGCNHMTW
ncbi:IBR domain-containing protein [Cordyceps militaris CM01]|uniref:IBR domain-containing protein n=1 Tax=Cordyceps militaris (strain CM01) TaxID=983644 RepID=G3JD07_CORMM|nr:IBR domain-containing protein [Cordyceps militaris CM01]EGX93333.1 IBR domain-containing protein [Cordyceps militaris CM01]